METYSECERLNLATHCSLEVLRGLRHCTVQTALHTNIKYLICKDYILDCNFPSYYKYIIHTYMQV